MTVSAPGVDVLVPAPDNSYQLTTGTSVAAANVSGVAALLLARDPKLTPDAVEKILIRSAHHLAGPSRDIGAGEVDALSALEITQIALVRTVSFRGGGMLQIATGCGSMIERHSWQ